MDEKRDDRTGLSIRFIRQFDITQDDEDRRRSFQVAQWLQAEIEARLFAGLPMFQRFEGPIRAVLRDQVGNVRVVPMPHWMPDVRLAREHEVDYRFRPDFDPRHPRLEWPGLMTFKWREELEPGRHLYVQDI